MIGVAIALLVLGWIGWAMQARSQNMFGSLMMSVGFGALFWFAPMLGLEVLRSALGRDYGTFEDYDRLDAVQLSVWAALWLLPALWFFARSRRNHGNVFDKSGMANMAALFSLWFVLGIALQPLYHGCPPYSLLCHRAVAGDP